MTITGADESGQNWRPIKLFREFSLNVSPLFLICVAIPTFLAVVYSGYLQADAYVSESRFSIRTQGRQSPTGLASLLAGGVDGFNISGSASGAVTDYIQSRDAVHALNAESRLTKAYNRSEIDFFQRVSFFGEVTREDIFDYYSKRTKVNYDTKSGIVTLKTEAYSPNDARWINEKLLQESEKLVNAMNQRGRNDLLRYAQTDVAYARTELERATTALASFRNKNAIVDPERQAEVSLQMISILQDELIKTGAQISQLKEIAPRSSQISVLAQRAAYLENEIQKESTRIVGAPSSMASKQGEYTKKMLDVKYAEKLLANSLATLQTAGAEAGRQQAYVERIVQPSLPDKPAKPERLKTILAVLILGFFTWGVLGMLISATKEHHL